MTPIKPVAFASHAANGFHLKNPYTLTIQSSESILY
jgi:hypothetical protein